MSNQFRTVSFYHKDTGLFHGFQLMGSDPSHIVLNTPPDHIAIEGQHDALSRRFDVAANTIVDYQPPQTSDDHEWNVDIKRWVIKAAITAKTQARVAALRQIEKLEMAGIRRMRELLVGVDERLTNLDAQITELRAHLQE